MPDEDVIIRRQCALENAAGDDYAEIAEAFERGFDDARLGLRPFRFGPSTFPMDVALAYANGGALAKIAESSRRPQRNSRQPTSGRSGDRLRPAENAIQRSRRGI